MRTIGSLPVALTDMSWSVFTRLNFASAITWTFALVGAGYVFGSALEHLVGNNWTLFSVVLLAVFFLMTYAAWRHVTFLARETLHRKTSSQSAKQ